MNPPEQMQEIRHEQEIARIHLQKQKNMDEVLKYNARLDARLAEARKRKEQEATVIINQQRSE